MLNLKVPFDAKLGLERSERPNALHPNVDHVCLRVDPWDENALINYLSTFGIVVTVERRYGRECCGPSIYISNPGGNRIELKWLPK
ncbi:MAG: hypothetical protein ACR2O7_13880 [Parasphingorhabdus sp.]